MTQKKDAFAKTGVAESYASETYKKVPGLADLHRMAMLLLSEQGPTDAKILVVGAGGGLEIKAIGEARPQWVFIGVDPSQAMLASARDNIQTLSNRVELIEGTVENAPDEKFDGATCLLVLHFLDRSERLHTLKEIHRRLKPGAKLVVAHHTAINGNAVEWLTRTAAFADRSDSPWAKALASGTAMAEALPLMSVIDEEQLMLASGFTATELFYAAFSFRGWVATA